MSKPRKFEYRAEDPTMINVSAMAFPLILKNNSTAPGLSKFEYMSVEIFSSLVSMPGFELNDSEMLAHARRAVRAAQVLFTAQNEFYDELRAKAQAEEANETVDLKE